ncbi:hypothetical protein NM688_g892 [Phlebia brevispora]|uniref:Uncharacterized protein n=1 Tax=Phlebia brevispora TaxID=194682 RepID=A0ACC1TDA7_9APHY|nr:hypothetical protein NM688_g892 [Phlebia brevispora]
MSSQTGSTKDLNDGKAEALHALLNSLSPGSAVSQSGEDKLSAEQVRKLSDKLEEIIGLGTASGDGTRRNEKGELVNEEGLPIIDINEPLRPDEEAADNTDQLGNFDDPGVLPLWTLSSAEKARRKAECDRILDTLEEEERLEETREAEAARARWAEEMEKRKEASKAEIENLKKAREMQKKMGKALLRSVVEGKEREEKEKAEMEHADREAAAKKKSLKPKKSVTFADQHIEHGEPRSSKGKDIDWGDVAPGRLRSHGQSALLTRDHMEHLPMKMHVVERQPRRLRSPEPPAQEGDSDDESATGSLAAADSEDGDVIHSDHLESDDEGNHSPLDSDEDGSEDGLPEDQKHEDWGGEDFDYAQHQREIALEYYEKRKAISTEVSAAMRAHTHDNDEWNQPDVPLEATLASSGPKPSVSRFKSERLSGPDRSTLASHSLGGSVLPSSHSTSLKGAVRLGKLRDGQLVGGEEGESDGELDAADENARNMLEMLKKGEVTNIGPSPAAPVETGTNQESTTPAAVAQLSVPQEPTAHPKPSKASKFKMSMAHAGLPQRSTGSSASSLAGTPVNQVDRSSPKTSSPGGVSPVPSSVSSGPTVLPRQMPTMIVESPSLRAPANARRPARSSAQGIPAVQPPAFHSVILESPSFQPPTTSSQSPAFHSVILESPSFQPPAQLSKGVESTAAPSAPTTSQPTERVSTPLRSGVVERRPPTIVSASAVKAATNTEITAKKKVSRPAVNPTIYRFD